MSNPVGTLIAGAFGAIVGSFLNVCIHRLPRGMSVMWPASACPSCSQPLAWYDNIPIVSFLVLGGRCRSCRTQDRHPLPDRSRSRQRRCLLHAGGSLAPAHLFFRAPDLGCALIVLFAIDLEHHLLPNLITLPGIVVGFVFSLLGPPGWFDSVLGILVGRWHPVRDRRDLLPAPARRGFGNGRREDARDDRRVPRLEVDACDAHDGVGCRIGYRDHAHCCSKGRHEVCVAIRDVSRARGGLSATVGSGLLDWYLNLY